MEFIEIPGPEPEPENERGPETRVRGQFIDAAGNYYIGDQQGNDTPVPERPSPAHRWNGAAWALDAKVEAAAAIAALEAEQAQRLTPRALRELYLGVLALANQQTNPAFLALKDIDDRIKGERAKLK